MPVPNTSRTLGHSNFGNKQDQPLADYAGLPESQEPWRLPYTDYTTDDHQNTAVDFRQFVNIPEQDAEEERFSMGSLDEEDLAKLADTVAPPSHQTPPTSVLREISSVSSVRTYDPSLQRSSPGKAHEEPEEEELLDSDIDWSPILEELAVQSNPHPLDPSASQAHLAVAPLETPPSQHTPSREPTLQPFTRSPFPHTLRDKSPICGLSNATVLRTCFRLGHLIAENVHNSSRKQNAIYELYARVNYSHRNRPTSTQIPHFNVVQHDSSARMQHFQFIDLWKDAKPYVWGVLENWRPDGVLDKQSSAFLSSGPPPSQFTQNNEQAGLEKKLCRCICRISKAVKGENQAVGRNKNRNNHEIGGWVMKVMWIEEVSWSTIERMRAIICRE
ncbi:hypothetical protein B0T21DRAFT_382228 [Apiosordaria backusii]|uniref:Uncharacterized protein n=1 Tax=Apiosordaria backusii TaxID=314023 RepID=A0AA40BRK4_9PEZI|nr:hypothetical protein B0T21DRAFT_382228 [Apiosordaria backusii]